jgi:putative heme-binding domain-containing protein
MEAGTLQFAKESHKDYIESKAGIGFDKRFADFIDNPPSDNKEIADMMQQFVTVGTEREMRLAVDALIGKRSSPSEKISIALLEALKRKAATNTAKRMNRVISNLKRILTHRNDTIAQLATDNLGEWKALKVGPSLLSLLKSNDRNIEVRQAAGIALAKLGGNLDELKNLANGPDIPARYAATPGLIHADFDDGVESAIKLLTADPGKNDPVPVLQMILKNRKGAKALSTNLKGIKLNSSVASRIGEFHRTTGQLPKSVASLFQSSSSSSGSLSTKLIAEDQNKLTADVVKLGDPHRGETIYRRKALACTICHAIGPAGPAIGPNLVAVGAAATPEYMVESILKPNAAIAEHYENRLFTMTDGTVQMGVISFKSEKEVVVLDSAQGGKEVRIPAATILREQAVPSLMPAGLADQLQSREEFLDLANFLSMLGRPGDFANDESPVLRKWRIAAGTPDSNPTGITAWMPAYSKVNGVLPDNELGPFGDHVFARSFVDVLVAGGVTFDINNTEGLRLWSKGTEITDLSAPIALPKGQTTITFLIDRTKRGDTALRVELKPAPNSPTKLQPEGGL